MTTAWDAWFDAQHDLCDRIDELVRERIAGKPPGFRIAVHAALIEHLAEVLRFDIDLPELP